MWLTAWSTIYPFSIHESALQDKKLYSHAVNISVSLCTVLELIPSLSGSTPGLYTGYISVDLFHFRGGEWSFENPGSRQIFVRSRNLGSLTCMYFLRLRLGFLCSILPFATRPNFVNQTTAVRRCCGLPYHSDSLEELVCVCSQTTLIFFIRNRFIRN